MKIFDSHVHFWDIGLKKHIWLEHRINSFAGDYSYICNNYFPQNLLDDAEGFELIGVTHVQAGWDLTDVTGETKWLESLTKQNNFPNAIVGYADLAAGNVTQTLEEHAQSKLFRGIRQILNWHENPYFAMCERNIIEEPNFAKGFAELKKFNLSFDLQAYPHQMEKLIPLFRSYDTIPIIINHCGMPLFLKKEDLDIWKTVLKEMSELPHASIKLSGLGMFDKYSPEFLSNTDITAYCIETFGVDRCMFGSNFPVDKLYSNYSKTLTPILEQNLSSTELEKILLLNAQRIYYI